MAFGDVGFHAMPDDPAVGPTAWARAQSHPTHFAIGPADRNVLGEIGKFVCAALFRLEQILPIFGQDLAMEHAGVGQRILDPHAIERLDAGAQVKEAPLSIRIAAIAVDGAVGQIVGQRAQVFLALAQSLLNLLSCDFGFLARGDVFAGDNHSADLAVAIAPRSRFPFHPLDTAVTARKGLAVRAFDRAGQHAPVHGFPGVRDIRNHLVMIESHHGFPRLAVMKIFAPARRDGKIIHVAVEHGDGGRGIFNEQAELALATRQTLQRGSFLGDVADDAV